MDKQPLGLVPRPVGGRCTGRLSSVGLRGPAARGQTLAHGILSQIESLCETAQVLGLAHRVAHRGDRREQGIDNAHFPLDRLRIIPGGRQGDLVVKDRHRVRHQLPKLLRTGRPQKSIGIARRQHRHPHRQLRLFKQTLCPFHRRLARGVCVVDQDGLPRKALQPQHLLGRQRRTQRRHGIRDAKLMTRQHVHIPFNHHDLVVLADGFARPVERIERLALDKDRRLF